MTRMRQSAAYLASKMHPETPVSRALEGIASIETPAMRWLSNAAARIKEMEERA